MESIAYLVDKDAVFQELYQQYGNPFVPSRPEGFQTLVKLENSITIRRPHARRASGSCSIASSAHKHVRATHSPVWRVPPR